MHSKSSYSSIWKNVNKINSLYHQQNSLETIFEEEIPALYKKDIYKVEIYMDKASSQTSKSTAAYLPNKESEIGIKCILFNEIPVKPPDTSPIDFCAFSLLKQATVCFWLHDS